MAWSMPPAGQWNAGMGNMTMAPDMNMGSYSAEQWAAMQHQNWQQWAQWQQQYAQWQNQYGEKYAEQMHTMQNMGGMPPPLPTGNSQPPPPPDQPPPPPPPHENNQPLYGQPQILPQVQVTSIQAPPAQNQTTLNPGHNNNFNTGNNQNWPYSSEVRPNTTQSAANTEALKKLAEEERLFDIQFQKWEEEIEKWRKENVNHPDKQAYNEYEQKFEACRLQLLERRQQMKQKRARLMINNTPQAANPAATGNNNISTTIPHVQSQSNQRNNPLQTYSNQNNAQYQQYNDVSQPGFGINNKTMDLQGSFESRQGKGDYSSTNAEKSSFIPSSESKGIPGLDLVPEVDKAAVLNKDVIDISEDHTGQQQRGPDYTKISKGINNILGDEKIMNILSMVRGQNRPEGSNNQNANAPSVTNAAINNPSVPQNNQWSGSNNPTQNQWAAATTDNTSNQQYVNRQYMPFNGMPYYSMQTNPPAQGQYYGNAVAKTVPPTPPAPQNAAIPSLMSLTMPPPAAAAQSDNRGIYEAKNQEPKSKWVEDPMFTPSIIVEYEHKPLRLKAREFIEPVHMFDYNHKSKEEEKKVDFEKEIEELFSRKSRRVDDRLSFDRDDNRMRGPPRDIYFERRRTDIRNDDRRRDDREKYSRREDIYRDRDMSRDRHRDYKQDDRNIRGRSNDRESRKRGRSKDIELSENLNRKSKEPKEKEVKTEMPKPLVMIDDILEPPGRDIRPEKIVIILRGPPGSGKSYLAKLIRDREAEYGGTARIMSIDDYFMQEGEVEERDPVTGKMLRKPSLKYEYDEKQEDTYLNSLKRAFKRSLTDGYFTFLIFDAVNDQLKSYADVWNFARQNGFQVYVCTMELDPHICYQRNIHNRTLEDIQVVCSRFFPTPVNQIELNPTTLLQNANITDVHMEDATNQDVAPEVTEVEHGFTSKWERMDDVAQLARLDGTSKPLRPSQLSMEDYLQIDEWKPTTAKPGKKTVRWADIEERRQQEKMRAIGFVVGQTDWNRMTDPTMGSSALTQTKYIERVRRFF